MGSIRETMEVSFGLPIRNPKILVPYFIFATLNGLYFYLLINEREAVSSSTILMILLAILFCLFILLVHPIVDAWLYSLVTDALMNNRSTFKDGIRRIRRQYFGFLGFEILELILIAILCIPLLIVYIPFIFSAISSMNYSFIEFLFIYLFFMLLFVTISICIQTSFAYMKPAYAITNEFFESIKEGMRVAKDVFLRSMLVIIIITSIGFLIYSPLLIRTISATSSIMRHDYYAVIHLQKNFRLWQSILPPLHGLVTATLTATAFTHLYLSFKRDSSPQILEQQPL